MRTSQDYPQPLGGGGPGGPAALAGSTAAVSTAAVSTVPGSTAAVSTVAVSTVAVSGGPARGELCQREFQGVSDRLEYLGAVDRLNAALHLRYPGRRLVEQRGELWLG
jgi:hypothetical protein